MVTTQERAEALVDGAGALVRVLPSVLGAGVRRELASIREEADRVARGEEAHGIRREAGVDDRITWGWYLGLGGMAALRLVEWRVALLLATLHAIERHSHDRMLDELAAGLEEGA